MTATRAPTATAPSPAPVPFPGFRSPTYTMVPDEVFDELLPELTGAELKVLLYIIRRTFGFKRESDTISLSQMLIGIHTRDGRVLDRGVGLSKKTLLDALRRLGARRIILTQRRQSAEKGNEPTAYRLNVLRPGGTPPLPMIATGTLPLGGNPAPPLGEKVPQGGGGETPPSPWGRNSPPQDSGEQERAPQETGHHPRTPAGAPAEATEPPLAPTASPAQDTTDAGDDDDALSLLISQGVTRRIAQDLVRSHPAEAIRQQVTWQADRPPAMSPAGALVRAIRDAWPPPPAWSEAQAHAAAVARREAEEAQRREEEEARRRAWAAKPPEERIAGRLQFWLLQQRAKRREPTAAEVAAKRAALLAEVAGGAPSDSTSGGGG
jgi:Bacteriophage replication protein O